jgi:hypothetical protein
MWPTTAAAVQGLKPGDVFTVDDPPTKLIAGMRIAVRGIDVDGASILIDPTHFVLCSESDSSFADGRIEKGPSSCFCDLMSLMRVGCQCGHMAREREARLG